MTALLLAVAVALASPQQAYETGVAAERQGNATAAQEHFEDALAQGAHHPAVYHGLGNALYRQGDLGRAIAAWRQAQALAPRNGDIAANLQRARRETRDRLEVPGPGAGPFFWQHWLSTRDSALASGFLVALALVGLLVRRWTRAGGWWGWESLLSGLLGLLLAASTMAAARQPPAAVVVLPEVAARSTLGPQGIDLFVLHEGAEVTVAERADDHALVVLPDERKGWVPEAALVSAEPGAVSHTPL
jgi:tetratricopeptide (TPR) repeat protein